MTTDGEASSSIALGAAELSPIEFDGAIIQQQSSGGDEDTKLSWTRLYVMYRCCDVFKASKYGNGQCLDGCS